MAKRKAEAELENEPKRQTVVKLSQKRIQYLTADKVSWFLTWKMEPEAILSLEEFDDLWCAHPRDKSVIRLLGKDIECPRWSQCFGKSYFYSGVQHKSIPFTPILQRYLDYANTIRKCEFNMCVVNWYENGLNYIGSHSDDEPQIYQDEKGNTKIFSISFGQERAFYFTPKYLDDKNAFQKRIELGHGDCLMMCGKTQSTHKHSLPKVIGQKGTSMGRRISLTFRQFR